ILCIFFFQAEDGIRDFHVTGVQTCALPISSGGEERRASAPAEPSSQRVGRDQLLLEARGVGLERKDGRVVLRDVDLEVAPGEILGIVGKNGAGKSTLLRVLAGLLLPACGRVLLEGFDLSSLERREIARRIAFLPQEVPA